jgi:carbonic anhydrase
MEGIVTMLTISQVMTQTEIHDVRELLKEYTTWAFSINVNSDQVPAFQGIEQELAALPGTYVPPTGSLLLARLDDQAAGCITLKGHDSITGEVKRLYVRPDF